MAMNGFGGLGASFPVRYGAPTSQNVASDQEWTQNWESKLAAVPKYAGGGGGGEASFATPWWQEPVAAANAGATGHMGGMLAIEQILNPLGYTFNNGGDPNTGMAIQRAADLQPIYATGPATINPEWERMQRQFQGEAQNRQETQIAQQQAYNSMLGNGQKNAVMGADYATPGFGRVDGQAQNPFTPPSGANMDWATGVYDPSGVYGTPQQSKNQWGL